MDLCFGQCFFVSPRLEEGLAARGAGEGVAHEAGAAMVVGWGGYISSRASTTSVGTVIPRSKAAASSCTFQYQGTRKVIWIGA